MFHNRSTQLRMLALTIATLALSFWSCSNPATDSAGTAPSAPTGLTVASASSTSLTVSWNSVSGATSYQVYRDSSATGSFSTKVYDNSSTSFTDTSLTEGTAYFYEVQATNSTGASSLCSAVSGTPAGAVTSVFDFEDATAGAAGWLVAPGSGNSAAASNFDVSRDTANVDPTNGGTGDMKVDWQSSAAWGMTELYGALPYADYSGYTGVCFDIKIPYSENFTIILRNVDSNTQQNWSYDDYVYVGDDPTAWHHVEIPFTDFTDPGWTAGGDSDASVTAFLGNTVYTAFQLNLNPVLNLGDNEAGEAVNTNIPTYIDNIGFYK